MLHLNVIRTIVKQIRGKPEKFGRTLEEWAILTLFEKLDLNTDLVCEGELDQQTEPDPTAEATPAPGSLNCLEPEICGVIGMGVCEPCRIRGDG